MYFECILLQCRNMEKEKSPSCHSDIGDMCSFATGLTCPLSDTCMCSVHSALTGACVLCIELVYYILTENDISMKYTAVRHCSTKCRSRVWLVCPVLLHLLLLLLLVLVLLHLLLLLPLLPVASTSLKDLPKSNYPNNLMSKTLPSVGPVVWTCVLGWGGR